MISRWSKADWEVRPRWQHIWDLRDHDGTQFRIKTIYSSEVMAWIKLGKQNFSLSHSSQCFIIFREETVALCHKNKAKKMCYIAVPDTTFLTTRRSKFAQFYNPASRKLWLEHEGPCQPLDQMPPFNHTIRAESDDWRFIFAGPASIWQQHQRSCKPALASCTAFIT